MWATCSSSVAGPRSVGEEAAEDSAGKGGSPSPYGRIELPALTDLEPFNATALSGSRWSCTY